MNTASTATAPGDTASASSDVRSKRERVLITPEGIAVPVTVASRGSRVGALILDFAILYLGMMLFLLLLGWIAGGLFEEVVEGAEEAVAGAGEFLHDGSTTSRQSPRPGRRARARGKRTGGRRPPAP